MDTPHNPPYPAMVEDLTEPELDVLRMKAQALSNQEIANELTLAVSTVKWYVRQIYGKLGVTNQREAVVRAQALGLIEKPPSPGIRLRHNLPRQPNLQGYHTIAEGRAGLGIMAAFQGDANTAAAVYEDVNIYLQSVSIDVSGYDHASENLSFLALLIGHFEQALAQYEATLSRFSDTGYRVPLMCAHSRAGHALIGLEDEVRAAPYLFDALGEAVAMGALQVFMEALLGIAQLSFVPPALATELMALVCEHPAANRYSRAQAKSVLEMTAALLPQEVFAAALQRGFALTPESAVTLVDPFSTSLEVPPPRTPQPLAEPLSQRELEVLVLVAHGLTNREIADRLYIGVSTVKKHINHIYSKLDVTHRAQAVAHARALNILS